MAFETRIARRVSQAVERKATSVWLLRGGRTRLRGIPAWAVMALLGVIALSPIVASALPPSGTVVVSAAHMAGWTVQLDSSTSDPTTASTAFVAGPGVAPNGAGSAALGVGSDGDGGVQLRNPGYVGTPLSDVTVLAYSTYVSAYMGCQAPYLILSLDTTGDGLVDDALFFEPCYQSGTYGGDPVPAQGVPVLDTWQRWNALDGGWWAFNAGTFGPPLTTISSYIGSHPGTQIVNSLNGAGGVRLAAGYGAGAWDDFVGNVDAFTIGVGTAVTTFDFEPSPGPAHLDVGSDGVTDFDFPTIQGAVDAANGGDTVRVDAGTYPEVVVITKTITLEGAQAGATACGRSSLESIVGTANGAFQILADNVVIDGFTITGVDGSAGISSLGAGIHTPGTYSGHMIRNNIITGNTMGVYLNSDGTFASEVENNAFDSNNVAGAGAGNAIYSDQGANDVTIRDNCFTGHDNAAMVFAGGYAGSGNTQTGITLSGNSFDNDAGGAVFFFASDLTITGNSWRDSLGTSVFLGGDVSDVTIMGNTFDSADFRGIRILAGAIGIDTTPDTDVVVNFNNFLDNSEEGLRVDAASYTGTLDATCNWWGDTLGPLASTNPAGLGDEVFDADGVVNFVPWLGTPLPNPCSGPVHLDIGSTGTPYDVNFARIQPAVTAASTGDTVYVDPGTYVEQVVIDAGIRLLPTLPGSGPTIRAPPFASRTTFTIPSSGRTWDAIVELKADGASIEGFTIDGFEQGGFCSGRSFTGIMMHGGIGMAAKGNFVARIRDTPFSGCQAGIGIAMYADTVGDPTTGEISGNTVVDYQKGGIVVNIAGAVATVERNLVVGVGPTHVIAQNGIQFGFGAGGVATLNTVLGHAYDDGFWTSAGILLYEAAAGTLVDSNTVLDNEVGIDVWFSTDATVQFNDVLVGPSGLFSACGGSLGAIDLFGIHFQDSDGTIEGNTVNGIAFQAGARGCQSGDGIVLDESGTVLVTGNIVTGYQKNGIMAGRFSNGVDDSGITALISNNVVEGWGMTDLIAQNGIQVADGALGVVTGNEVSGNWYSPCGDYLTCFNAAGILVIETSDAVVSGNVLTGNQAGVNLYLADFMDVLGNTISGSAWGVIVDTSNDVDVLGNSIGVPTVGSGAVQIMGIWALDSLRVNVAGNTINFGGAVNAVGTLQGIRFQDSAGRITGNSVRNVRMAGSDFSLLTGIGIVATGAGDLRIADNNVRNYQWGGIFIGMPDSGYTGHVDILDNTVRGVGPTRAIRQIGVLVSGRGVSGDIKRNFIADNCFLGSRDRHGHDGHDDDDDEDDERGHHDNDDGDDDERDRDGRGKCRGDAEVKGKDKRSCPPGVAVGLLLCNVDRDALNVSRNRFSGNQVDILRVRT